MFFSSGEKRQFFDKSILSGDSFFTHDAAVMRIRRNKLKKAIIFHLFVFSVNSICPFKLLYFTKAEIGFLSLDYPIKRHSFNQGVGIFDFGAEP